MIEVFKKKILDKSEREVEEFLRWSPYVRREHSGERRGVAADREPLGI